MVESILENYLILIGDLFVEGEEKHLPLEVATHYVFLLGLVVVREVEVNFWQGAKC